MTFLVLYRPYICYFWTRWNTGMKTIFHHRTGFFCCITDISGITTDIPASKRFSVTASQFTNGRSVFFSVIGSQFINGTSIFSVIGGQFTNETSVFSTDLVSRSGEKSCQIFSAKWWHFLLQLQKRIFLSWLLREIAQFYFRCIMCNSRLYKIYFAVTFMKC